jgi:pyruvate,orthophosphate dikinase
MQDFEFTVQDAQLYFLQSRSGNRTPWAALRIATDLVRQQLVSPAEAMERLRAYDLASIVRTRLVPPSGLEPLASATPAGMGVATGALVTDCARAESLAATHPVILVRPDLTTDDVKGLAAAAGIVTANGGRTSHAAVVARHLGKVCLVGCSSLRIDEQRRRCWFGTRSFSEGDVITLDGESGLIFDGAVPATTERPQSALEEVRRWQPVEGRPQAPATGLPMEGGVL